MASIILTAVGNSIAPGIGGAIGGFIGRGIDSAIFGGGKKKLPDQIGSRLENLAVQVSTYGETIPHIYGYARIAGNVIWALDIKEVETRSTTSSGGGGKGGGGGGGGGSQTTITYKYYATLAIAICEGQIDNIIRVWADAKALTGDDLLVAQGKYESFYGTETQLPSAIMERYKGAGNVPAYRGTAYVVIEDMPLEEYGNRIPNFTFEVLRKTQFSPSVEDKVKSIMMIPGSGEFVYSRDVVSKYNVVLDVNGVPRQTSEKSAVNLHTYEGRPDVEVAVDQLLATFPNIEWVGVAVSWYGNSKHAALCEIFPKVEYHETQATTTPVEWAVAGYTRNTAPVVNQFGDGTPTYGGTPTDKSVLDLCVYLKSKGLSVMLYPFLQIDTTTATAGEDDKPWRGRVAPSSSADVTTFFTQTNGYNRFIRHYAQLNIGGVYLKNNIDAFIIGSEMVGLTSYDSGSHTYPAVTAFKTLAANVQTDLGGTPLVGYAADWSEYHSTGGWYNMDPLWTDANIDFVGIDAYFPITPDLPQTQIDEAKIKEYWEKGEGWDYYYTDSIARTGLTSYGGNPQYAWKNVENWWNSAHTNPSGGGATGWTAKMKPIWFTEYGFPSTDGCANQPNVFYDPRSAESLFPRGGRGRIDYQAQREAINATEDYLEARNLQSGKANLVPRRFLWTWDARPFPFFPDLRKVWADYLLYPTGHWVNGKLGGSTLGSIVAILLQRAGLTPADYDVSRLQDAVEGFIIDTSTTTREALEVLQTAFMFDSVESEGILKFVPRGSSSVLTITEDELLPMGNELIRKPIEISRAQELDMPNQVSISYLKRTNNYATGTQLSQRQTVRAKEQINTSLPIVMSDQFAKQLADMTLYNAWIARVTYSFNLPPKYVAVEPGDVITVQVNNVDHVVRILSATMTRNGSQEIKAVAEDISTYDFYTPPGESPIGDGQGVAIPETDLILLDLPPFPTDSGTDGVMRAAAVALSDGWAGATLYRSADGGELGGNTFTQIGSTTSKAVKGSVLNNVGTWAGGNVIDTANTIDVALVYGELSSVNDLALLNGANAALIGNEIIQFQTATLTAEKRYTLSNLLRGRLGTERDMVTHLAGTDFILLDGGLSDIIMPPANFGLTRHYKAVTFTDTLANTDETAFIYTGKTLRPFSPVQIRGARDGSSNLTITWIRRTRISGEWRDGVDVPLAEENERYDIEILNGSTVVRTFSAVTTPSVVYSAANQTTDFGSPQASVAVIIYQLSTIIGRGVPGEATV
jgi:hypothetical protein